VAFSQDFLDLCNDPWGEAMMARLKMRLDTDGGSGQLVTVTNLDGLLDVSPLDRRRERKWGVVQAQTWQVRLDHQNSSWNPNSEAYLTTQDTPVEAWGCLEIGFPAADKWEVGAQGKLQTAEVDTRSEVTLEFADPLLDVIAYELPRDLSLDAGAWVSPVYTTSKAAGSSEYDNTNGTLAVIAADDALVAWETFVLEFKSATTFDVVYEDGTTQSGGPFNINANLNVKSLHNSQNVVQVMTAGWDQTGGAYSTGDTFTFYTSPKVAASDLNPVGILIQLLTGGGYADFQSYNVLSGASQDVLYDLSGQWLTQKSALSSVLCKGLFPKGTRLVDMVQGILRAIGGSIYPTPTGQLALWVVGPAEAGSGKAVVTGDPDHDDPSILYAKRTEERAGCASRIIYNYLLAESAQQTVDGEIDSPFAEATMDAADSDAPFDPEVVKVVDIPWAISSAHMESQANIFLSRFSVPRPKFEVHGTLTNALDADITDLVALVEPALDEAGVTCQVTRQTVDLMTNTVTFRCWEDPNVSSTYAKVDTSLVDSADKVW